MEARAELRDTRGFISMARMRPSSGLTANWMFDPPVSTPISRITLIEASRSAWYSLSVRVCAGATVMLSPVCTPMGSKFSMEQMMTTLSARSRMTSSSYSFHPMTDSSMSTSVMGLVDSPHSTASAYSDSLRAMLPPAPPRVKAGRMMAGKARVFHQFPGLFDGPREPAPGHLQADAFHGLLEQFPVLRHLDRLELGADEFDPVTVQRARLGEFDGDVQGGLSTERGQQHVGALAPDDLLHVFRGDGLDVGPVRHVRVRHDRGRIAVDQHDPVAFFAERPAGLGAGIVELAGLADDDRPGADDQDGFDVGAFRQDDSLRGPL